MAEFKKITEVDEIEAVGESDNILVESEGKLRRAPASGMGGTITPFYLFGSENDLYLDKDKKIMATPYDVLKAKANGTGMIYVGEASTPFVYTGVEGKPLYFSFSANNMGVAPSFFKDGFCGDSNTVLRFSPASYHYDSSRAGITISLGSFTGQEWYAAAEQVYNEL